MRKAVFIICLLNLVLLVGALLYFSASLRRFGELNPFFNIIAVWILIMALMLVLLSFSVWKDEQALENILNHIHRSSSTPEQDEMKKLRQEALDSILQNVDIPHYEKAKTLVDSFRKEGWERPELGLRNKLDDKMKIGLTMEQAIDELCKERGLNCA